MASITWGRQLETGLGVIDRQHKHWVDLFNALARAVDEDRGEQAVNTTLGKIKIVTIQRARLMANVAIICSARSCARSHAASPGRCRKTFMPPMA